MRITGGSLSGRNVTCPPGVIRPAMDRMRESFYAILGPLDGLSFLDLFTGSGCIGLEAYSRGAWPVRVVEKDGGKREVILKNLSMAERRIDLSIMPAERFVKAWKESFDLIFLYPPFDYPYKAELLRRVLESRLVHLGTHIYMHVPDEDDIPAEIREMTVEAETAAAHDDTAGDLASTDTPGDQPVVASPAPRRLVMTKQKISGRSVLNVYRVEFAGLTES